jgi:hypothetical protein
MADSASSSSPITTGKDGARRNARKRVLQYPGYLQLMSPAGEEDFKMKYDFAAMTTDQYEIDQIKKIISGELPSTAVSAYFLWCNTPQGQDYWEKVEQEETLPNDAREALEEMVAQWESRS